MPSNRQISLRNQRIIALHLTGMTMSHIAAEMGVAKNTVVGVVKRHGNAVTDTVTLAGPQRRHLLRKRPLRTMEQRLQALHDKMDRLLAEQRELRHLYYEKPHAVAAPKARMS